MRRLLLLPLTAGVILSSVAGASASVAAAPHASYPPPRTPVTLTSGFFADPDSVPATWVRANKTNPSATRIQSAIGSKPIAKWFGAWSGTIGTAVGSFVGRADNADKLPVLVAYNLPGRDACGGHSAGGADTAAAYDTWISAFASAIGTRPAIVVIEPDSLGDFGCMTPDQIAARNGMLNFAARQFHDRAPNTWAYLDAGNAGWIDAATMADRLNQAGVANVRGFSLNVSNYYTTAQSTAYAAAVNSALSAKYGYTKQFVADTSRNGNGSNGEWCNPAGRKLGTPAQVGTGSNDMLLWIKTPGASDGLCGIAPTTPAGTFTADIANHLISGV
ncbi:MAG: endoglucanase [Cryptosporangiaceae bacterium]|nr:endoglucanase [Cryptosporangiaceae bacterium]